MLTNMSLTDIKARGEVKPCDYQEGCMRNQSRIWVRARLTALQQALRWGYLTYVGRSHFNGHDKLEIWVSDDGYSDVTYLQPLSATGVVPITVVAVNNAPSVTFPGGQGCTCREATGICSCDTMKRLAWTVSYYQWEDADQMTHLRLKGRILDINQQATEAVPVNDIFALFVSDDGASLQREGLLWACSVHNFRC
ncbi:hypothetical protein T484DRAFT_2448664 [Baffinella frigidus]|nr:hypothetical protein T484DRAFT_2448664 [Cryptophyta sp. CCMP2293]